MKKNGKGQKSGGLKRYALDAIETKSRIEDVNSYLDGLVEKAI